MVLQPPNEARTVSIRDGPRSRQALEALVALEVSKLLVNAEAVSLVEKVVVVPAEPTSLREDLVKVQALIGHFAPFFCYV